MAKTAMWTAAKRREVTQYSREDEQVTANYPSMLQHWEMRSHSNTFELVLAMRVNWYITKCISKKITRYPCSNTFRIRSITRIGMANLNMSFLGQTFPWARQTNEHKERNVCHMTSHLEPFIYQLHNRETLYALELVMAVFAKLYIHKSSLTKL